MPIYVPSSVRAGALAGLLAAAGCATPGAAEFSRAQALEQSGDLEAARTAYRSAAQAAPGNAAYADAASAADKAYGEQLAERAVEAERAGQWSEAAERWRSAAELAEKPDYAAKAELAGARADSPDVDGWYESAARIAESHPESEAASTALERAKKDAYAYHVELGREALAKRDGKAASEHLARAEAIDPSLPGLNRDQIAEAEAWALAAEAEALAADGDAEGAYEKYRAAVAKRPSPELETKMNSVKARVAKRRAKLAQARKLAERRRYPAALKIYDELLAEAPSDAIDEEAGQLREDIVRKGAEDARRAAERGNTRGARKALQGLVPQLDLDEAGRSHFAAALELIGSGSPTAGLDAVKKAGLPEGSPALGALDAYALAEARNQVDQARKLARKKPTQALLTLAKLTAFEAQLPQIVTLRQSLKSEALEGLLVEAVKSAKKGDDVEAAAALRAALDSGDATDALRRSADEGIVALREGRYADAQRAFDAGLAAAPRSRLAREGSRVAEIRRTKAEEEALVTLRKDGARSEQAVATLEASRALSAASGAAAKGRALLQDKLDRADKLSNPELARTLGYLARLSEMDDETRGRIEDAADAIEGGRFAEAEKTLASAEHPVAARGREIARSRVVGGLASAASSAATEASAKAIAQLFERNPNDPAAKKALNDLLAEAEAAASRRDDAETARLLGLATVASNPEPDLKAKLDAGHAALAGGDVGGAAAVYAEAKTLAPKDAVATRAASIARKLDAQVLATSLESGKVDAARAALKRTLERSPDSPEAAKALEQLLSEADAAVAAGRYAQAAELYETANVATKPEPVRASVAKANTLLAQQKLKEAAEAYGAALQTGRSNVASRARAAATAARSSELLASVKTLAALEKGTDLARAALQVRSLLRLDPTSKEANAAVKQVLDHAAEAARLGDAETVARDLGLVADALGQASVARRAIALIRRGSLEDAEASFGKTEGMLAERGPKVVSTLRVNSLREGLSAGGLAAARNLRELLRANPNDPEAQKAFAALLTKVKSAAEAGEASKAAEALREANVASGAVETMAEAVDAGAAPLGEGRFVDAQIAFERAKKDQSSEVVEVGLAAAKTLREAEEDKALVGLTQAEDPRPAAEMIAAVRKVDPSAPILEKGLKAALDRAEAAARAVDTALLARSLAAAGRLEASSSEGAVATTEAADMVAKNTLEDAEKAYGALRGRTAEAGKRLVRQVRVAQAQKVVDEAKAKGDVLAEALAMRTLRALAPDDKAAQKREAVLVKEVRATRVASAKQAMDQGKPGVAFLYASRALEMAPGDEAASKLKADAAEKLKAGKDLIVVVEAIGRDGVPRTSCGALDPELQAGLMEGLSKRTDLGGFVLSEGWTKAWREKDDRAPKVSGGLTLVMKQCVAGSSQGKAEMSWKLSVPKGGATVAEGSFTSEVAPGQLLRDEQDGAGKNVRAKLVEQTLAGVVDGLKVNGTKVRTWLLTAAEHALEQGQPEAAAAAFARFRMNPVASASPARVEKIQADLDRAFP